MDVRGSDRVRAAGGKVLRRHERAAS
jgi:hypothetical protein